MSRPERQQNVLDLLKGLRGIEPLKQLFWSELNYQRINQTLSRRGWTESASKALADDPVLFAGGGEDNAFHVIYCRLASDALARGFERPVVTQMLREHPYALFIFSNKGQIDWHFLNVKFDDQAERRQLYRRITVRPGAGLRTATERVQLLDLAEIHPELIGITPLAIQQRCDAAFDVEAVTKDFFSEVANWYFWALKNANFPKNAPKETDGYDHISIIRLITRLIFCWFVKEKGLIPDTLFDQQKLAQILTGFDPAKVSATQSVFYKTILQNLFFATLNTEMDKRAWRKDDNNFMAHIFYRHRALFQKPNEALDYFKNIPFLNGGLFECLDKREGTKESPKDTRIDGFSDRSDSQPTVPDFLFFGPKKEGEEVGLDWQEIYGCRPQNTKVRGLIHIFNRYNFTVEENTPIEQEVALDPELSGKVFENLLAAYNPETGATARKQTGSFYTPREIVNYMVDESLIACLKTKLETALPSAKDVEARLRQIFAYTDEPHQFTAPEVDALIAIIDSLKTLDPAVGSGAFPMGILHKLVFILGKLDPHNKQWKQKQIEKAAEIPDATVREKTLDDIEKAFEQNELDYGRKLYLIENCIYGVDIQPIAVQIAKMRFFISLIVDQKIDDAQPNRGVRPLPNLETKFVAANTLIGINRPGQQLLRNREIDAKEAELRRVRERHFNAKTPKQKTKCREEDARLRAEIAELLKGDGWDTATARNLADWNPYDQNAWAGFFDAEWMFGITDGFDVVIGNPPYGAEIAPDVRELIARLYSHQNNPADSYLLFMEKAHQLLKSNGVVSYIVSNTWLPSLTFQRIRRFLTSAFTWRSLLVVRTKVFAAVVDTNVFLFEKSKPQPNGFLPIHFFTSDGLQFAHNLPWAEIPKNGDAINVVFNPASQALFRKMKATSRLLKEVADIYNGVKPFEKGKGRPPQTSAIMRDKPFVVEDRDKPSGKHWLPLLRGSLIHRYVTYWKDDSWIQYGEWLAAPRDPAIFEAPEKLFVRQTGDSIIATHGIKGFVARDNLHIILPRGDSNLMFLLGMLNSQAVNFLYSFINPEKGEVLAQVKKNHVEELPIPKATVAQQKPIIDAVKSILATKKKAPTVDTSALEREIDQQVYALYGLTPEEIKIVEAATK